MASILISPAQKEYIDSLGENDKKALDKLVIEMATKGGVRSGIKTGENHLAEFLLKNNCEEENKEYFKFEIEGNTIEYTILHASSGLNHIFIDVTTLPDGKTHCIGKIFKTRSECDNYKGYILEGIELQKAAMPLTDDKMKIFLEETVKLRDKWKIVI